MKIRFILIIFTTLSVLSCRQENSANEAGVEPSANQTENPRIISLSGLLTETLFTLGQGDAIVGRDITGTYPGAVDSIPSLGHVSRLNIEALLALKPDFVFAEESEGKYKQTWQQLEQAGIEVVLVKTTHTLENSLEAAQQIAEKLDVPATALEDLSAKIKNDSALLSDYVSEQSDAPKVLFIYARGAGTMMVGGVGTAAAAIIEKAGGQNAVTEFEDFKPLTPESLLAAQPEVLLMFDSGLASLSGKEGLAKVPGMAETPALKNDRIITMDGHYLTAFGPRAGEAALELAKALHGSKKLSTK